MNDRRGSDSCVVPAKLANKAGRSAAELVEGRRLDEGYTGQQHALRTQGREGCASSALERVRRVASKDRDARFTALLHHVGVERLRAAYRALSPRAAAGVDALVVGIERKKVNWVLDADFRDFFTSLDHSWLVRFLEHRIADKRVLRL